MFLAGALHKHLFLSRHFLGLLFPHGPTEDVGVPERVSRDDLGCLHDLLLIDQHTVGFLNQIAQERVGDLNRSRIFLSLYELGNELHRTWTVQRDQGDDFLET